LANGVATEKCETLPGWINVRPGWVLQAKLLCWWVTWI